MPETHGWLKELELKRASKRGHINKMKNASEIYCMTELSLHKEKDPANTCSVPTAQGSFL